MSGVSKKLMGTTAAGGGFTAIEDVFSTYLYTGNDSTQTITNGIDLAGEGGLVWLKNRTTTGGNTVYDTERGASSGYISTNTTSAQSGSAASFAFNSDGFTAGSINNSSPYNYASWTFRKAPRFFDVVTYTGDGVAGRTISHNLGTDVGTIIVKQTDGVRDWPVYHRGVDPSNPSNYKLVLNKTDARVDENRIWNDTEPTDTVFTVGNDGETNGSGNTYVAYLFAHDPLGPSGDGSDGLIACGSYTGTAAAGNFIDLGWEPQWVLVKNSSYVDTFNISHWEIYDSMRGVVTSGDDRWLRPNTSEAEQANQDHMEFYASGFSPQGGARPVNTSGDNYIYIAIRAEGV